MSVFREHKTSADRSARDRARHKEKIEHALKEGIHHIVSNESIIGKDGKTKIKIPVRGIKEYRFIFGDNEKSKHTGTTPGKDKQKGQVIGKGPPDKQGGGKEAGEEAGEEMYEVEVTLSELASYLFDDLNLPDLEKKKFKLMMEEKPKRKGHRNSGIKPRLDKKETLKRKIRRQSMIKRENEIEDEDFKIPLDENDLRYRHVTNKPKECTNAVVFFVMDVSGSMTDEKKYLARSFFFILYQFLRYKYEKVEIVFISHTTDAEEVTEDSFFSREASGGTMMSPAIEKVANIVEDRYHPDSWNVYAFHCSDGDNFDSDCAKTVKASRALKELCQMYCYCEIVPIDEDTKWGLATDSSMMQHYKPLVDKKFVSVKISTKKDVWPSFKKVFGGKSV